jgi:2-polyprenyl-3-methyl-5-hydroxy-6-metoxy-1,4-benzoquinol methylase
MGFGNDDKLYFSGGGKFMIDALTKYYEQEYNEDNRLKKDRAHSVEFLTSVRYLDKVLKKESRILDACAGTGVYSFYLASKGHQVTAGDIVEHNVSTIKDKQLQSPLLKEIYSGNVLDMSRFDDGSFNAVLCMGALYHLKDKCDREKAVRECLRVLKSGGIFVASYINKHAVILLNCEEQLNSMDELLKYNKESYQGVFYGSTPREIIELMQDAGLVTLYNIASDGTGYLIKSKINDSSEENFNKWLQLHFETCEEENLLGYSLHGLYFGIKK